MGRFLRELDNACEKYSRSGCSPGSESDLLKFNFLNCNITGQDVIEMTTRLSKMFLLSGVPPIHMAFPCCSISDNKTLADMEAFLASHTVHSLSFSVTNFTQEEIRRLIRASKHTLKTLHLTLRYKESIKPNILEACTQTQQQQQQQTELPLPLEELRLDAMQPMESRVRLPRMQELSEALPALKGQLKTFQLVSCEFDDDGFAILVGGLLPMRDSLQNIYIQNSKSELSPRSLAFMTHLMTDMPHLIDLFLDIKNGKRMKLFSGARTDQVDDFITAVQQCSAALKLSFSNVGMTETVAVKLVERAAVTNSTNFSLWIEDCNLVQSVNLLKSLQQQLPLMKDCTELSLVDTTCDGSKWRQNPEAVSVANALAQNKSLEKFHLVLGIWDFVEDCRSQVNLILQRNIDIGRVQQLCLDDTEGLVPDGAWPQVLARTSSSPTYLAVRHRMRHWLSLGRKEPQQSTTKEMEIERNDTFLKEEFKYDDERLRRPTPTRRVSEDFLFRQKRLVETLNNLEDSSTDSSEESGSGWDTSTYSGSEDEEDYGNDDIFAIREVPLVLSVSRRDTLQHVGENIANEADELSARSKGEVVVKDKKKKKRKESSKRTNETYEERMDRKAREKKAKKKATKKKGKQDEAGTRAGTGAGAVEKKKKKKSKKKRKAESPKLGVIPEEESPCTQKRENTTNADSHEPLVDDTEPKTKSEMADPERNNPPGERAKIKTKRSGTSLEETIRTGVSKSTRKSVSKPNGQTKTLEALQGLTTVPSLVQTDQSEKLEAKEEKTKRRKLPRTKESEGQSKDALALENGKTLETDKTTVADVDINKKSQKKSGSKKSKTSRKDEGDGTKEKKKSATKNAKNSIEDAGDAIVGNGGKNEAKVSVKKKKKVQKATVSKQSKDGGSSSDTIGAQNDLDIGVEMTELSVARPINAYSSDVVKKQISSSKREKSKAKKKDKRRAILLPEPSSQ